MNTLQAAAALAAIAPPAAAAGAISATVAVKFAETPGLHEADQIIDYNSKLGMSLYNTATKALTSPFDMKPTSTVTFIQELKEQC